MAEKASHSTISTSGGEILAESILREQCSEEVNGTGSGIRQNWIQDSPPPLLAL